MESWVSAEACYASKCTCWEPSHTVLVPTVTNHFFLLLFGRVSVLPIWTEGFFLLLPCGLLYPSDEFLSWQGLSAVLPVMTMKEKAPLRLSDSSSSHTSTQHSPPHPGRSSPLPVFKYYLDQLHCNIIIWICLQSFWFSPWDFLYCTLSYSTQKGSKYLTLML